VAPFPLESFDTQSVYQRSEKITLYVFKYRLKILLASKTLISKTHPLTTETTYGVDSINTNWQTLRLVQERVTMSMTDIRDQATTQINDNENNHLSAPTRLNAPPPSNIYSHAGLVLTTAFLAACGGGGDGGPTSGSPPAASPPPATLPTEKEAQKFTVQAMLAPQASDATLIQQKGFNAWIDTQFAIPQSTSRWQWLNDAGFNTIANQNSQNGFDQVVWMKLLTSPDELRQRMTLALSQIIVIGIDGLPIQFRQFAAANYFDILEDNAFGNYRTLLEKITASTAMGSYLTYRGNQKADTAGRVPDENYARELLQLFTIGLYELNLDGTLKLVNGKPDETYGQDDVSNLARVFTGWDYANNVNTTADRHALPMVLTASKHSPEAKIFLGKTIAAGTDGVTSLKLALDHIFAHPNVAPFVSKQLIQKFVTSNPSPAYVQRIATIFNDNGASVRGDLKAVLRAILTDSEATTISTNQNSGKLKEPVLRFLQWAKTFGATTNAVAAVDQWKIGNLSDPATKLGQSPGRSPSVFNFFRPGYVPPASQFATLKMTAPEFQITHESSVVGYLNFMQSAITNGIGDVKPNYLPWLTKTADPTALVAELNKLLAAGALSASTQSSIATAIASITNVTDADKTKRVQAAIFLIMASPEYLVNA
jgi:uncharacterized protein (DUF1800 family)